MNYQYIIIVVVLLIVALAIVRLNKNKSKCKVTLNDVSKVNKEAIQKLGARGIVEIDNQLKIILGSEARTLKKYIDEYILDNKK